MSNPATSSTEIEGKIRSYILDNLMFTDDASKLPSDASLLDQGIVDSTGVLEIVMFLEEEFGLSVQDAELLPENFDSVERLTRFVGNKLQAQ